MPVRGKGGELAFLAVTIAAALFFLTEAFRLPMVIRGSLGPGLYPALVLVCILLVAAALLVRTLITREIRILSPFLDGLQHDTALRRLAGVAGGILGTAVRVVARTGSGWFSAFDIARRSPADGYTLALVTSETADLPNLEAAAFALDTFEPVARLWFNPDALVVRADASWTDVAALFADARSLRVGFVQDRRAAAPIRSWLARHAARPVEVAEFDAAPMLLQALHGGRLDAALLAVNDAETGLAERRLRCLAALSDEPVRAGAGALTTSRQQGVPLASGRWGGLMLPRGVEAAATAQPERLSAAFADASLRVAAPGSGDGDADDQAGRARWSVLPPVQFAHFLGELRSHMTEFNPNAQHPTPPRGKIAGLVLAAGGLLAFPLLMSVLGFPLTATLYLASLMLLLWTGLDAVALVTIACVAPGVALLLDRLFGKVFYVVFPSGALWGS